MCYFSCTKFYRQFAHDCSHRLLSPRLDVEHFWFLKINFIFSFTKKKLFYVFAGEPDLIFSKFMRRCVGRVRNQHEGIILR